MKLLGAKGSIDWRKEPIREYRDLWEIDDRIPQLALAVAAEPRRLQDPRVEVGELDVLDRALATTTCSATSTTSRRWRPPSPRRRYPIRRSRREAAERRERRRPDAERAQPPMAPATPSRTAAPLIVAIVVAAASLLTFILWLVGRAGQLPDDDRDRAVPVVRARAGGRLARETRMAPGPGHRSHLPDPVRGDRPAGRADRPGRDLRVQPARPERAGPGRPALELAAPARDRPLDRQADREVAGEREQHVISSATTLAGGSSGSPARSSAACSAGRRSGCSRSTSWRRARGSGGRSCRGCGRSGRSVCSSSWEQGDRADRRLLLLAPAPRGDQRHGDVRHAPPHQRAVRGAARDLRGDRRRVHPDRGHVHRRRGADPGRVPDDTSARALWSLGYVLVYQQIENYVLSPRLTAKTMSLHPAVAFAAVLIGGALGGSCSRSCRCRSPAWSRPRCASTRGATRSWTTSGW